MRIERMVQRANGTQSDATRERKAPLPRGGVA
jgi:hypothetical protein